MDCCDAGDGNTDKTLTPQVYTLRQILWGAGAGEGVSTYVCTYANHIRRWG